MTSIIEVTTDDQLVLELIESINEPQVVVQTITNPTEIIVAANSPAEITVLTGVPGRDGKSMQVIGAIGSYSQLPSANGSAPLLASSFTLLGDSLLVGEVSFDSLDQGDGFVVKEDGQLYIWDGTKFPDIGKGVPFVGPKGDRGDTGPAGPTGPEGAKGDKGESLRIKLPVATYSNLPVQGQATSSLTSDSQLTSDSLLTSEAIPANLIEGDAYLVQSDGLLYVWNGTSFPAQGQGVPFVGPRGLQGEGGAAGPPGPKGEAGQGLQVSGAVTNYAGLPSNLTSQDAGKAYVVNSEGLLYIWSGTAFPAAGQGVAFVGAKGDQGIQGQQGAPGVQGIQGQTGPQGLNVYNGIGPPSFDARPGESYIDVSTGDVYSWS